LEDKIVVRHGSPTFSKETGRQVKKPSLQNMLAGGENTGDIRPKIYQDKDGLPVTYTRTQAPENKVRPDEISVLWHELLSPLTVIKGYTSTLLELDYAITEDQKKQYLQGIESASNRVIRLLENLRDITSLEEMDALLIRPVSLVELLKQIVFEVQSQTTKHVIKLIPPDRLPLVKADAEKFQQVLSNLLGNAVKYTPQGGDITVEIRMVQSEAELAGLYGNTPPVTLPCIIVSVADSGIGIPEEELGRIFDRFYRVNSKQVRSSPGAGLGLYICRLIVEAHGGHIWAKNRRQGGSMFNFSIPLDR
jgi:signal transduction histidine kinase